MAFVYLLECGDGTLYCGWTNFPYRRLCTHQAGKGGKYTRTHLPVKLVYLEKCAEKHEALSREFYIKHSFTKQAKLQLIKSDKNLLNTMTILEIEREFG